MTNGPSTFLVDANVLVYAVDVSEDVKQLRALKVLTRLGQSGRASLSVQVLGESYNAMTRRLKPPLSPEDAEAAVLSYSDTWPVHSVTDEATREAMQISRQNQASYWDSLIVAVARLNGVEFLLTEDIQGRPVIAGVTILNPLDPSFDLALLD